MILFSLIALACSPSAPPTDTSTPTDTHDTSGVETGIAPVDTAPETLSSSISASQLSFDSWQTRNNPLKGFLTSYQWATPANDMPDQMEFLYIPMDDVWNESGSTLDTGLDPFLDAAESRGHHAVVRIYIDYPNLESGLPSYLANLVSCQPYDHFGPGCSPDYDDPDLLEAMVGLIEAMGKRYDGDPRLGFLQLGLIGFWGEWHTYPYSEWFPSEETQKTVLAAFESSFSVTQLQIRRPAVNSVSLRMGFHDDSFAYSTIGEESWFFLPGLEAAGADTRWTEVAIGGELRPELQSLVFSEDYLEGTYAQDPVECIEKTHTSYLLNYKAFNGDSTGYLGNQRLEAELAAIRMGYQFEIEEAEIMATVTASNEANATFEITLTQSGIAPFYYPIFLKIESTRFGIQETSAINLQDLLPGQSRKIQVAMPNLPDGALTEPFALSLVSPILQDNQQILFATTTPWSTPSGPLLLQWNF